MKTKHIIYGVLIVAVIIIISIIVRGRSHTASDAVAACVAQGGAYDVTSATCVNGSGTSGTTSSTGGNASNVAHPVHSVSTSNLMQLPSYNAENIASSSADIRLLNPQPNGQISSPLYISGSAIGSWYFEAVFPVYLTDLYGHVIAQGQARAQSDWRSPNLVPFQLTLNFPHERTGSNGLLIFKNANPSGNAATSKGVEMPIVF